MDTANTETKPVNSGLVQDRKTGEWYSSDERFMELMNKPEVIDVLKRLANK